LGAGEGCAEQQNKALQQLPVDLIHSVVMRGLDPRIHHLCKIYAKKMDPRVKPG